MNDAWTQLRSDTQALITSLRRFERPEEIAIGVASLERRQTEARRRLEQFLDSMNSDPKGPENRPHNLPTNQVSYSSENIVVAHEGGKSNSETGVSQPETDVQALDQQRRDHERGAGQGNNKPLLTDAGVVLKITTTELTQLAPRLRNYLTSPRPAWPEVINAADWLRGELGVSQSLWGEACVTMGREEAAIAITIVSAKSIAHFRSTPGGYFHGMVAKAKAGELNLARALWGLRHAAASKPRNGP